MRLNIVFLLIFASFLDTLATSVHQSVNKEDTQSAGQPHPISSDHKYFNRNIKQEETVLTKEDFERAKHVSDKTAQDRYIEPTDQRRSDLFQGDIRIDFNPKFGSMSRNAIRSPYFKWQTKQIPYTLSSQYSSISRAQIAAAMQDYAQQTCISFVPRTTETDYIFITPDSGCYSSVGRQGGQQIISLDSGCIQKGVIMHELMHSVGFFHEQSRTDRDNYVDIIWANIGKGFEDQFQKYSINEIDPLNTEYDYGNGQPTIVPKRQGVTIGQRNGFSATDRIKINRLYQCEGGVVVGPSPSSSCSDIRNDCELLKNAGYCTSFKVYSWMTENCRRTCGKCNVGRGR